MKVTHYVGKRVSLSDDDIALLIVLLQDVTVINKITSIIVKQRINKLISKIN